MRHVTGAWFRWVGSAALVVACTGALAAVGIAWRHDRARVWEEPRFRTQQFVRLAGGDVPGGTRELWLVAVNPRCPHCSQHLAHTLVARRAQSGVRVGILLVDTPKPPAAELFSSVGVDGLWWDERETWRRRWGHRIYGETMVFDAGGHYLRTLPPGFDRVR